MTATAPSIGRCGRWKWILLLTLSLVWAGSFLFNGIAVRELPVFTIVVRRGAIAAMILLLVCDGAAKACRVIRLSVGLPCHGFLNNVLPFSLIVWGQGHISPVRPRS
ncbi:MAG: hypothetical protein CM15mP115_15370 [Alphaproteobacteria bacterium]|nr:MAG: hypothetical protein CM15mP115_15370 [Alphaproteobacteria bacterium]